MHFGHYFRHKMYFLFNELSIYLKWLWIRRLGSLEIKLHLLKHQQYSIKIFSKSKLLLLYCNMASKNTCCYNEWRILPQGMKVLVIFKKRSYSDLHYFNPQGQSKFCFPIRKKWRKPYTIIMPGYVIVYELETISCL